MIPKSGFLNLKQKVRLNSLLKAEPHKRIIFHALSVSEQCAQAEKAYKEQESAKCALLCMSVGVCMSVLVHTMHK